jgi:hypothetical protein
MTDTTDAGADRLHAIPVGIEDPLAGRPDQPVPTIAGTPPAPRPAPRLAAVIPLRPAQHR